MKKCNFGKSVPPLAKVWANDEWWMNDECNDMLDGLHICRFFLSSECIYLYCRNRDLIGDDNPPEDRNAGQREHWTHAWMIHNLNKSKKITDSAFQSHFLRKKQITLQQKCINHRNPRNIMSKGIFLQNL